MYVEDYVRTWRGLLKQKMTLVCFQENSDEIIGLNVVFNTSKADTYFDELKKLVSHGAKRVLITDTHRTRLLFSVKK